LVGDHRLVGHASPSIKAFKAGTHRTLHPEETLRRGLRLAPIMGITRIANVTGLDTVGVPVVMVCRPNARSLAVSQGKGLDLPTAKASGLMESVETYHAETITLPLRLGSYEELRYTDRLVDAGLLPTISTGVFHPNRRILWCEGRDLLNEESVWVPYEIVHTDFTWPQPAGSGCFASSSNGLASGNHLTEAISHGICEVVERDCTTLWSLRGRGAQESREVDLASVDDAACQQVLEKFARAGLSAQVWDTTTDVGIVAFICVIREKRQDPARPIPAASGMGCHPARSIALLRALTEAAQSRLTLITGSRDDLGHDRYARHGQPLMPSAGAAPRRFSDAPDWDSDTIDGDLEWELRRLRSAGIRQVIVVDLTKKGFGLPVVRVIIPGLEGHHGVPGYVPSQRALAAAGVE
jgi:YcaO-like protein with predicted kinase domain